MEFSARLEKFDSPLWGHHVKVPEAIAQHFIAGGSKRVLCTLNGLLEFQCALMPAGNGIYFININKQIRGKLGLKIGSHLKLELRKDDSKYGLPMPEELQELLEIDEEGNRLFHALTPGKQRNLIYIAGQPKSVDKRIERAVVIVDHLKKLGGKIDFKMLYQTIKESNRPIG